MPNLAQVLFGLIVILGLCIVGLCRDRLDANQRIDELEDDLDQLVDQWELLVSVVVPTPPPEPVGIAFEAEVEQLRRAGLCDALVREIQVSGPEIGGEIAQEILAAGSAMITALNTAQAAEDEHPPAAWCDPTHGRIDRDIQDYVATMHPTGLGQRVAIENTLQYRRDHGHQVAAPSNAVGKEEG
jgi:hypothetical protein